MPFKSGMEMSMIMSWGDNSRAILSASRPLSASATTFMSGSASKRLRSPWRTIWWSSAKITFIIMVLSLKSLAVVLQRHHQGDPRALDVGGFHLQAPPEIMETLPDAEKAETPVAADGLGLGPGAESHPVVLHLDGHLFAVPGNDYSGTPRLGMLDHVHHQLPHKREEH